MEDQEQNPYEPVTTESASALLSERKLRRLAKLILVFELPALILMVHGLAYLLKLPGAEVIVNEYGGKQPIALSFFRILATGGLCLPLAFGCWLSAGSNSDTWKFGLVVGVSYAIVSLVWWLLIGMGVMMRFV